MDIVTPKGVSLSKDVVSMVVPAQMGYLGVLAGHAPLVAALGKGRITLTDGSGRAEVIKVEGGGFLEVLANKATLILNS